MENGLTVKLQTLRAKSDAIFNAEDGSTQLFRAIPILDEMNALLDEVDLQTHEALRECSKYYGYLGGRFALIPFYPNALRCYVKAFSKFRRSMDSGMSGDSYEKERLCELFVEMMAIRGRIYVDTDAEEGELGIEYSVLMKNLVGVEEWNRLLCEAARKSEGLASVCRGAYTQQYYTVLYEVESEAARRIAQLDPALVSPSSINALRAKLFAARGIEWTPSQVVTE